MLQITNRVDGEGAVLHVEVAAEALPELVDHLT